MAGGRLSLRWTYTREGEQVEPQSFRLYHDGGSGSVDYDTVIATVPYRRGRFHYRFESAPFADGTRVRWAVRAVSATGAEDLDTVVVSGWADASAPPKNPTVLVTCEGTA
jgi:hypothetical protein